MTEAGNAEPVEKKGSLNPGSLSGNVLSVNQARSGSGFLQIVIALLVGLFCLGFGVGVRSERLNRLAETYRAAAGYFRLEGLEAPRDIQVLRHIRGGHALPAILEAA